jgi:hypothetical protein
MSVIAAASIFPFGSSQHGVSSDSKTLQLARREARAHSEELISMGWRKLLKEQLIEIWKKNSTHGWDGYDAEPISKRSIISAMKFLSLVPDNVEPPTLSPEPTGEIAIEWDMGRDMVFSVTAGEHSLIYAGVLGPNKKWYGEEAFNDEIPEGIANILVGFFLQK